MVIAKLRVARMLAVIMISATLISVAPVRAGIEEERAAAVDKISCADDLARCIGIVATGALTPTWFLLAPIGIPIGLMNGCMCRVLYRSIRNGDRDPALAGVVSRKMTSFDAFSRVCGMAVAGVMTAGAGMVTIGSVVARSQGAALLGGLTTVICGYNCRALARNINGDNLEENE